MQQMLHATHNSTEAAESFQLLQWLVIIYRVPTEPSSARSAIWRETKRLGALSLQNAVRMLPLSEANRQAYSRLAQRIENYGGEASVLETISPDADWQTRTIARFNAARDEEYGEMVDEAERFREEIDRERHKSKFTFAELEDQESNLERLHTYLSQVAARDRFSASGRGRAQAEIERCAAELEIFTQGIYQHQATLDDTNLQVR